MSDDKPSKKELESAIGGSISDDVKLSYGDSEPSSFEFELVAVIKNKFKVYKKSLSGKLIAIYVFMCGFGFPLPSLYDLSVRSVQHLDEVSHIVYESMNKSFEDRSGGLVIYLPEEFPLPEDESQIDMDNLPTGSGIYPLSADDFRGI